VDLDLIGRIPDGKGSNKFIFIANYHYSKWVETKILNSKSSKEVSEAINELIIKKHGIPETLLSDCGLEFKNNVASGIEKELKIKRVFSSPHHHQTTGAIERVNQSLMNKIKKLSDFGRKPWTEFVDQATLAVNISYNRAIGTSPYFLKTGRQFRTKNDETSTPF
jgi:hypothetical protein